MPARSAMNKKPIVRKAQGMKKKSSTDVRDAVRTPWTIDSGKSMRRVKRERKPAEMEMNRRYRAGRQSVDHFHPEHFAVCELEAIAKGRGGEAWTFVMRRNDVPQKARDMARAEITRREAARGRK